MRDLTILQSPDGISFTDDSLDMSNYIKDDITVSADATGGIYVGLYKPFYKLYAEIITPLDPVVGFSYRLLDPVSDIAVTPVDETKGGERSGFITWERDENWKKTTVDGKELYWFRIYSPQNASITFRAINLVFSNDDDLVKETSLVTDRFKRSSQQSLISYHVSARDEILQRYRNSGKVIINSEGSIYDINQWDINRPEQLREASKFLALAKLFFDVSSEIDDKYYQKYTDYMSEFQKAFDLYLLSIDANDDGKEDNVEARKSRSVELVFR